MEKKNVQRIVGVLVIVALVIVVMPLLFGKNDLPAQQVTSMKAPPFPDQDQGTLAANQVDPAASQDPNDPSNNVDITPSMSQEINDAVTADNQAINGDINGGVNTTGTSPELQSAEAAKPVQPTAAPAQQQAPAATADVKPVVAPVAAAAPQTAAPTTAPAKVASAAPAATVNPAAPAPVAMLAENNATATATLPAATASDAQTPMAAPAVKTADIALEAPATVVPDSTPVKAKHVAVKHKIAMKKVKSIRAASTSSKTVKSSSNASWVVQMGAFKVKDNAVRLTDKLRAAGFKAFFHDVKTASGKVTTHVYVGPEAKMASAAKLSGKVQRSVNMQGIVVAYKPLAI